MLCLELLLARQMFALQSSWCCAQGLPSSPCWPSLRAPISSTHMSAIPAHRHNQDTSILLRQARVLLSPAIAKPQQQP